MELFRAASSLKVRVIKSIEKTVGISGEYWSCDGDVVPSSGDVLRRGLYRESDDVLNRQI